MQVRLIAIGGKMPAWVNTGVAEFEKRLPKEWRFDLLELPIGQRSKSASIAKAMEQEQTSICRAINPKSHLVALDSRGKSWSTEVLSQQLENWQQSGKNIDLLIGGPDGLTNDVINRADQVWSLSALTFPHPLVRIVVVEQLYRAWAILQNHPYHK